MTICAWLFSLSIRFWRLIWIIALYQYAISILPRVCVCCVGVHLCMYKWRLEEGISILVYHFLPYFHETGSFTEFGAKLASSKSRWSSCLHCIPNFHHWGYRCVCSHTCLFTWVLEIQTQVLMFVLQVILPTELLLSSFLFEVIRIEPTASWMPSKYSTANYILSGSNLFLIDIIYYYRYVLYNVQVRVTYLSSIYCFFVMKH